MVVDISATKEAEDLSELLVCVAVPIGPKCRLEAYRDAVFGGA